MSHCILVYFSGFETMVPFKSLDREGPTTKRPWLLQPFPSKFWVLQDEDTPIQNSDDPANTGTNLTAFLPFFLSIPAMGGFSEKKKKTLRRVIHSQARNMWERSGLNKYLHLLPPKGLPFFYHRYHHCFFGFLKA